MYRPLSNRRSNGVPLERSAHCTRKWRQRSIAATHPGVAAWEDVICWAEMNVFLAAKRGGWLDALRYFSAMSLRSMKAWSHWERVDADWRVSPPRQAPHTSGMGAHGWIRESLSNAECAAQRTLDAMKTMGKSDWDELMAASTHLNAFCQWMELMLDAQKTMPDQLSQELLNRYPGFSLVGRRMASKDAARYLTTWVLSHDMPGAKAAGVLAALRFCLRHHPEYGAVRTTLDSVVALGPVIRRCTSRHLTNGSKPSTAILRRTEPRFRWLTHQRMPRWPRHHRRPHCPSALSPMLPLTADAIEDLPYILAKLHPLRAWVPRSTR